MLDLFDPGKLLIVAIVALLVIGPKDLPRVLRTVGQVVGKMRRMAAEFQGQFMDAMKEAELDEVRNELKALGESARIDGSFDPTTLMRDEVAASLQPQKPPSESLVDIVKPTALEIAPEASPATEPAATVPQTPAGHSTDPLDEVSHAPLARGQRG